MLNIIVSKLLFSINASHLLEMRLLVMPVISKPQESNYCAELGGGTKKRQVSLAQLNYIVGKLWMPHLYPW